MGIGSAAGAGIESTDAFCRESDAATDGMFGESQLMKVSVSRTINAAHQLPGTRLHGHSYHITAIADATKNPDTGYSIQFHTLAGALRNATEAYDHDRLDRMLQEMPATAENLATCIARSLSKTFERPINVRVAVGDDGVIETDMYRRDDGEYFSR